MQKAYRLLALAVFIPGILWAGDVQMKLPAVGVDTGSSRGAMLITPNYGQWADSILFRAGSKEATLWATPSHLYLQTSRAAVAEPPLRRPDPRADTPLEAEKRITLIPIGFPGALPVSTMTVGRPTETRHHFFLGRDTSRWRRDVPTYASVTLNNVYPEIALEIHSSSGHFACRWLVGPGGDPHEITIRIPGAPAIASWSPGAAVIQTDQGNIPLPRFDVYSRDAAGRLDYSGVLTPVSDTALAFTVSADNSLPAIGYGTYLGGTDYDAVYGIDNDPAGRICAIGNTESADFPTANPYDSSYNGGAFGDVVISKFSSAGGALTFSTFIGGDAADISSDLILDTAGFIYATGVTASDTTFPLSEAYDSTYGGYGDAFIFKMSPAGDSLLYSSFVGGSGEDYGRAITVDRFGAAYVTGRTSSLDFPLVSAADVDRNGLTDAFVAKMSPAGDALTYSSYLGGSVDEEGYGIAIDSLGRAVVRGWTSSLDFPTPGGFQTSYQGGEKDIFVARFSVAGDSLEYGTYFGGSSSEYGIGLALGPDGSVYLSGATRSADFPLVSAYDSSLGGLQDLFVARLAPDGDALLYSTYFGGSEEDFNGLLALDECGTMYLTGYTYSTDYPTVRAVDQSYNGGSDLIVTLFPPTGDSLLYSSYLGGSGFDFPGGISVAQTGAVTIAGLTNSPDFPTLAPLADTLTGDYDMFATVISGFAIPNCDCSCPCHADPQCDGVTNVLDVVGAVNVAFRNAPSVTDPGCPYQQTDVNCDGVTNVIDVVHFVNVAFRNGDPNTEFCVPCP